MCKSFFFLSKDLIMIVHWLDLARIFNRTKEYKD